MFAIVETNGAQYKVTTGTILELNRIDAKDGKTVNFDKVLLISDATATKIGTPYVKGAYAIAKIVSHQKGDKVRTFKMRSKDRYRRNKGHRQQLTTIEITDIKASGSEKLEPAKTQTSAKESAPKTPKKASAKPPEKKTAK
ncbi:50S ribosomal protein L21 [Candidatus Peregrinibacteria bacterium]|nr:50S ribosomal protein L21 [Candidatus Peregrinibacteria bacterium]